jgi:hypothetical protein
MVSSVSVAFFATARTGASASPQQSVRNQMVRARWSRQNPRCGLAYIGAVVGERDAVAQRRDVVLSQTRVRT